MERVEREQRKQREESSVTSSRWSQLPEYLVITISERFNLYADYVRLSSVSKSWYSFLPKKPYHPSHGFPLLILFYKRKNQKNRIKNFRNGMFRLANNKLYHIRDLPDEFLNCHSWKGSSHGWLAMDRYSRTDIYLYNPFTKANLTLPPINGCNIRKVILSSTPPGASVAIYGGGTYLAYARPGDEAWTDLKSDKFSDFNDVLFHGNKLYALQSDLKVYVFHIGPNMQIDPSSCSILQQQPELMDEYLRSYSNSLQYSIESYLLESSSNDVLMVVRVIKRKSAIVLPDLEISYRRREFERKTIRFLVFKWEGERWIHVKSIGEEILFVGLLSSLSISSRNFSDHRGNCIYFIDGYCAFTHDRWTTKYDKGVFSLEDDCIEELSLPLQGFCIGDDEDSWKIWF